MFWCNMDTKAVIDIHIFQSHDLGLNVFHKFSNITKKHHWKLSTLSIYGAAADAANEWKMNTRAVNVRFSNCHLRPSIHNTNNHTIMDSACLLWHWGLLWGTSSARHVFMTSKILHVLPSVLVNKEVALHHAPWPLEGLQIIDTQSKISISASLICVAVDLHVCEMWYKWTSSFQHTLYF